MNQQLTDCIKQLAERADELKEEDSSFVLKALALARKQGCDADLRELCLRYAIMRGYGLIPK